nr:MULTISPECIES: hypothetical protein [Staphylococcaceae]
MSNQAALFPYSQLIIPKVINKKELLIMKTANINTRKFRLMYNFNHIVDITELEENGYMFRTFSNEDYVNVGNGIVIRRHRDNNNFLNNTVRMLPLAELLSQIKTVRNLQGQIIYKRPNRDRHIRKVNYVRKDRLKIHKNQF